MKPSVLVIWLLCACGGPQQGGAAITPGSGTDTATTQQSVEDVSLRWARAALGGNRAEAIALSLTHAQFAAITTKPIERADYDAELAAFIDQLGREGSANAGIKVVATRVGQRKTLPAGEKLRRETEIAAVIVVLELPDGTRKEAGMPMFFIRTEQGWRFSPKK